MFKGKVALITGAGSGIGKAIAELLAERGTDLALNDIDARAVHQAAEAVTRLGIRALPLVGDVASTGDVEQMVELALERLGHIDHLVNNAGFGGLEDIPLEHMTDAQWDRMIAVHLTGTFKVTRAVVPAMKRQGRGRIVNMSSISGMVAEPYFSHYCAAKAGILGFTKAMAKELLPHKINVNAIAPGTILTPYFKDYSPQRIEEMARQHVWGRLGQAREVAYLVAFLLSDEADYITGQVISPNGGEVIVGI